MKVLTKICWLVLLTQIFALPLENNEVERKINPEEVANEFEGDIVISENPLTRTGRNGITDLSRRWLKNSKGQVIVPFKIQAAAYCEFN